MTCLLYTSGPDPALFAGAADKFQHFAELRVGHAQRRIVLGPAHGEKMCIRDRHMSTRTCICKVAVLSQKNAGAIPCTGVFSYLIWIF